MIAIKNGLKADKGRSYREIEGITGVLRRELGYKPVDPFDASRLFEFDLDDITVYSKGRPIEICNHVQACADEGLTRWDTEKEHLEIILSEQSYNDLQEGLARPKFTVCHEFGHATLHTDELIRLSGLSIERQAAMYRERQHAKCFDSEWQANAFAAAILMPALGVRILEAKFGYISEDLIAEHFGTSMTAARYRLESMDRS